jgi:hypothetical protein
MLVLFSGSLVVSATSKISPKVYAQSQDFMCPAKNIQHWDKIVFLIRSPELAQRVNLTANTELDIKVLDDPLKVADLKQKVLTFLNVPDEPRDSIQILEVRYAIICA